MKKCKIYHSGIYLHVDGVIKNKLVCFRGDDNNLYFPEKLFMAKEECQGGLIQIEIEGKWGFADIYTGEIKIDPVWDYVGPFYSGYAHVALEIKAEHCSDGQLMTQGAGGKHGYVNSTGRVIIPLEYDDARYIPYRKNCFAVAKDGKWGMVDNRNSIMIEFNWDVMKSLSGNWLVVATKEPCQIHDRYPNDINGDPNQCNCNWKWGVINRNFDLMELDEQPTIYKNFYQYYILKKGRRYGVIAEDGQLISDTKLLRKEAIELIKTIYRR